MSHKILILLLYQERPKLLRTALESILAADQNYVNWHVSFHDDSSGTPGEPIVREAFPENLIDRVTFYKTHAHKRASGGLLGFALNQMIRDSDADLGLIVYADDALHTKHLANLNCFFTKNPKSQACYYHVAAYDPETEKYGEGTTINSDASQPAWRLSVNKDCNVWFPYPCHKNHATAFYKDLYAQVGDVPFLGSVGQYRAIQAQENALDDTETVIEGMSHAATVLFNDKDYDECHRLCTQIIKAFPWHQEANFMLDCIENRL